MKPSGKRSGVGRFIDAVTFPLRAVTLFEKDKFGLSALSSERYDYVAREVQGYCLDIGCGPHNRFVDEYLRGNGKGIDIFLYEGLTRDNLVEDITRFPFEDSSFKSVTLIASINHIPRALRDAELAEAYRCVKPRGNIIVTMGEPWVEILVHQVVFLSARLLGRQYHMDTVREMQEGEEYYLKDSEITDRLSRAGFRDLKKKRFWTQWGLNHLLIGWK